MSSGENEDKAAKSSLKHRKSSNTVDQVWEYYLYTGDFPANSPAPWFHAKRLRPLVRHLPSEPRCRICYYPFNGIGGTLSRLLLGVRPSKVNPYFCNQCEKMAERFPGGAEVEVTILFADIRGSTSIAERMKPADFSLLIKHFYQVATRVLFDTNAIVEKLVGDAVTGFYTPGFTGPEHAKVALDAASQIIRSISGGESAESRVPVGIGLHTGIAYVGSVTTDSGVANIAILGDAANVCARLASLAGPGEIYLSQATADAAGVNTSELQHRSLELKGRMQAVDAFVFLPLTTLHQSGS